VSGSHVVVDELPIVDVSGSSVKITEMPALTVEADFQLASASNVLTTTYFVEAGDVQLIPSREGRKRIYIQALFDGLNIARCRLSDAAKTSATGVFMVCGDGVGAEIEQFHSDALKFWNVADSGDDIELVVLEEF
jgi:hypothetical protein